MEQVGRLTVSQQQMVEIARALSHEAKVVIMDEPTSALTPNEINLLFDVIRKLKGMGIGILYVSHKLEEVFALCDRATVFRDGMRISTRAISETDQKQIVTDMVGREITTLFPHSHSGTGRRQVLDVRGAVHRCEAEGRQPERPRRRGGGGVRPSRRGADRAGQGDLRPGRGDRRCDHRPRSRGCVRAPPRIPPVRASGS